MGIFFHRNNNEGPQQNNVLEKVGVFGCELDFHLCQTTAECRALDSNDLGDSVVGETFLPELAYGLGFRHQLVQAVEQLVQLSLVADDGFDQGSSVRQGVQRCGGAAIFVFGFIIEGKHVAATVELAIEAVSVAQPELALRAVAASMRLLALSIRVVVASVFAVLLFGDLHPLTGRFEIDVLGFTWVFIGLHGRSPPSA